MERYNAEVAEAIPGGDVYVSMDECDDGEWVSYVDHCAEIDRLRAENDRLTADASRYQYLRSGGHEMPVYEFDPGLQCMVLAQGEKLDRAIDAALAAGGG